MDKKLTDEQEVAEIIHSKTCSWNHTDGCSWMYENWEKPGWAKKRALEQAQKMLKFATKEHLLNIFSCLEIKYIIR